MLPLVPGYLSMVSGLSAAELSAVGTAGADAQGQPVSTMRPMLRGIGLFIAGFTVVFVALGAVASGIGQAIGSHKEALTHLSGVLVILLGIVLLVGLLPSGFWSKVGAGPASLLARLTGERRIHVRPSTLGTFAAPIMGMAFAFAWTPCIGPVLGVVLGLAEHNGTLAGGVVLLFAYSLGLGVPFVVTGLAFGRVTAVLSRARRGVWLVEVVAAGVLIAFGILLLTDQVAWISTQFQHLLDHIGLSRLSRS